MQLLKLDVKNWVHHRQRTCEFTRGLVAILGENGSGKSSLFGAIRWLLTGENPNYGVKADNISQYAKEGEPSNAALEFEHNGHIAVVTRHLLPEKEQATLLVDGKEVARGDKAVTAGIEHLLGVDAKFISRFIIVAQTEIFSFIDDSQTETDKFFQRLFNTAAADKCQDVIGKALAKIDIPEIAQSSAHFAVEIQNLSDKIAAFDSQIADLPTLATFLAEQESAQKILKQWEDRQRAADELQKLADQISAADEEITTTAETIEQYEKDVAAFVAAISGKEEAHRAAKIALGHWETYKNVAAVKARIQKQREQLAAERAANPEPASLGDQTSAQIREEEQSLRQRITAATDFLAMFAESGVAACPTCHTPSSQLQSQVAEQQQILPQLQQELVEKQNQLTAILAAEKAHHDWSLIEAKLHAREAQLNDSAEAMVVVKPPEDDEAALQQTVEDFEDFNAAQNELQPVLQELRDKVAGLRGAVSRMQSQQEELRGVLADATITEADAFLAQTALEQLRQKCSQRQLLEQERAQVVFEKQRLQDKFDATQQQEADAVKLRQWVAIAEEARDALKQAPRIVAQRNLQKLESAINELLQIFSVNFVIKVANSGSPTFVAEFYDGRKQPAQRLSIGQKTVLALAFRVAVNAMFAEDIGLLALDEPTAALDQPRIQALAPVLEKLRELSTAKGLQCLLVTHAASLSHLFESTIELEPPELRHVRTAG